ncbi:MAG: hypothetical protein A2052_04475 [Deltaproteobacteria bacterium GWA2_54_12]|nr:MAG: hypothetical protein A2052_04475 [Deltaproteobacteria bacterium GWA2_54_12]
MARPAGLGRFIQMAVFAFFLSGCAAAPVALLPAAVPAIIAGAGGGITYTFTNIAYRTITRPPEEIERATLRAMEKMSIRVEKLRHKEYDTEIYARTRQLKIIVTLERMTPTLTRMKVNAKKGLIFKDKNTAFEIIYQTEFFLTGAADAEKGAQALPKSMQENLQGGR